MTSSLHPPVVLDSVLWDHNAPITLSWFPKSPWETWQRRGRRHAPNPGGESAGAQPPLNIEQMSWTRQQTVCLVVFCKLNHGGNIKGCNGLRRSFLHTYQSFIMRPWATRLPNLTPIAPGGSTYGDLFSTTNLEDFAHWRSNVSLNFSGNYNISSPQNWECVIYHLSKGKIHF